MSGHRDEMRRDLIEAVRARRKATIAPWIRAWSGYDVHWIGGNGALRSQEDIDAAVAASNFISAHGDALLELLAERD